MTYFEAIVCIIDIMKVHVIFETARDQLAEVLSRIPARAASRLRCGRLRNVIGQNSVIK